jgi:predicted RNA-binding Zn ribbon-like protein
MATGKLADLRIVGGHPALDLANTVAPRPPAPVEWEFLPDPETLLRWAGLVGVLDDAEREEVERAWHRAPDAAGAALADVLSLRDSIAPALAGRQLDRLTRRWAAAIDRSALRVTGPVPPPVGPAIDRSVTRVTGPVPPAGGPATLVVGTDPATMIGDRLADAIVDLLRHVDVDRLRVCPLDEGGCGWLFVDRSRNNSRRWCSMDDCGTHAKSRRLTARRRARNTEVRPATAD